jgi:hypothetical protein
MPAPITLVILTVTFREINTTKIYGEDKDLYTITVTCLACAAPAETSVLALVELDISFEDNNDTAQGKLKHQSTREGFAGHDHPRL